MWLFFIILLNTISIWWIVLFWDEFLSNTPIKQPTSSCEVIAFSYCNIELFLLIWIMIWVIWWWAIKILRMFEIPKFILTIFWVYWIVVTSIFTLYKEIFALLKIDSWNLIFNWTINFIFIIAFFVFLNTLYSIFFIN